MINIRTIRHAVNAFRLYMEDRTGRENSQPKYPPLLIYYFLKIYRSKISYIDTYMKSRSDSDLNVELTIPCVELEKVDMVECPCAPASGCKFFKSKHPLPKMVPGLPNAVTLLKQQKDQVSKGYFTYVNWYNFQDRLDGVNPAQAKEPYFTMKNIDSDRHLYVYRNMENITELQAVTVAAHFSDPLEVASFPVCGDKNHLCDPMEEEFVIEEEIQARVFEETYNSLVGLRQFNPGKDLLNNDQNETV